MRLALRTVKYSERLGEISDAQLQQALDRFGLGTLLGAAAATEGLFGQNLFVTSTGGEYVLRGKPHYDWQFPTERYFAQLLAERTHVPVPYPYVIDESTDIFGWSYVLMPRLAGLQQSDREVDPALSTDDLEQIAVAQAVTLAEAQTLTWSHYGRYDPRSGTIAAPSEPYADWLHALTRESVMRARSSNERTTQADLDWVDARFREARKDLLRPFQPRFVMHDYKPGNMLIGKVGERWQVTGLFDLMESHFGHGESDLSRMFCFYVGAGRADLARLFASRYLQLVGKPAGFSERFAIFVIHDRAVVWEWLQRTSRVAEEHKPRNFKEYVSSFLVLQA